MSENTSSYDQYLATRLDNRREEGLYRLLTTQENLIDFCSNDYLGFANHPGLKIVDYPELKSGSTGSRLISGNSKLAEETEKIIADYHHAEAALIFNAGYMANVGLFSCLAMRGDTYISDEYVHASIIDGMRLSPATRFKFRHNDMEDLETKLMHATGKKYIAVESVYSMDGDLAPLHEIIKLARRFDAAVIVDEAHATGVFGEDGKGCVVDNDLKKNVFARIHTFGKAMSLHGAAVVGSHALKDFLINHARAFIYATALPPHLYLQIQAAYHLLPNSNRTRLLKLVEYFKNRSTELKNINFLNSPSQIQGIIIGDNEKTKALAKNLLEKGYFVKGILSPTVAKGSERLRICLHSFNEESEIDGLLREVVKFYDNYLQH